MWKKFLKKVTNRLPLRKCTEAFCMSKNKLLVMITVLLTVGLIYGLKHRQHTTGTDNDAILVEVDDVKQGVIPIDARAIGTLVAAQNVQITPEVAGHVSQVLFKDGSFVQQGTPLIHFDDAVYQAKLQSAKANLLFSERNYHRMILLGKRGAIAKQAIDQAEADLEEKKAIAAESQVMVNKMLLNAPFAGVLGKSQVGPGDYVTVGQGLVALTDIHHLRVEYTVAEKYLPVLKLNQNVTITTSAFPGRTFQGRVTFISPTINVTDRTVALYADVPNQNGLLAPGMFVNVTQSLGHQEHAVLVSAMSILPTIDGQQVFKIINNKAIAVPVEVGQRTLNNVQIIQGLAVGDKIVTAGQQKLKDGMTIKIKI